ncbi:LysR family transcriptional regulator [Vagococcus silagei]|uniref:LysR family transcriptional regulator n=1 Tax=Vagococcus silagei TaxID=2508885 RepID=A0A4S3B9H8_9ENTE|nr:LysR family transcriptional regulator [Vagococcus silagei]THB61735.1 LysR family transcriptional regulator [Vagococcus silagei]
MISKLDLYRIFNAVAEQNSFSKAAKQLHLSQPSISQSILQLEEELDTILFNRTSRGANLTSEGALLFDYTKQALTLLQNGEQKLIDFKNLDTGQITIGVADTLSRYFLLPHLETFHDLYPDIHFKIMNGTTFELSQLLKTGQLDLAICNFPIDDDQFEQIVCQEIHDIFVCGNEFAKKLPETLNVEDLPYYPLIILDDKSNSRQFLDQFLVKKRVQIEPEFELGSHELLLEFAKINLGIACVTKEFSLNYLSSQQLQEIKLTTPIPKRSIGIIYLKQVALSPAAQKLIDTLVSEIQKTE